MKPSMWFLATLIFLVILESNEGSRHPSSRKDATEDLLASDSASFEDEDMYDDEVPDDNFGDEDSDTFYDEASYPVDKVSLAEVVDTAETVTEVLHDFTSVFKVISNKQTKNLLKNVKSICKYAGKAVAVLGVVLTLIEPDDVSSS